MTEFSDQLLSAYLDGELSSDERQEVEAAIAGSADLQARLQAMRTVDRDVSTFLRAIEDRPLPEEVRRLLSAEEHDLDTGGAAPADSNVVPLTHRPQPMRGRPWGMAIAASIALVVGLGLGTTDFLGGDNAEQRVAQAIGIVARENPLHDVLETVPSGAETRVGSAPNMVTPVFSFVSRDGLLCREFEVNAGTKGSRNVACRQPEGIWRVVAMAAVSPAPDSYQPAAADTALDGIIDEMIDGEPLDRDAELSAIRRGWRTP